MDSGNDIIMFFAVSIVIHGFLSRLKNYLVSDYSILGEKYRGFQNIQSITEISVAELTDKKDMFIGQGNFRMFFEDQRKLFFDEAEYFFI